MTGEQFCQSCAMPLTEESHFGTNADGTKNEEYCIYCYKDGAFTSEMTMEEMIEICIPHTLQAGVYSDENTARAAMREYFPKLKRWQKR
ncbi:MAG: transcriptional regulator [Firmicutes bacterium]|nr:transcriptional regulator [Bacillota bacterium]